MNDTTTNTSEEYHDIEVILSEEDKALLLRAFIVKHFSGASLSVFDKELDHGSNILEAAGQAMLNQMILNSLTDYIEEHKLVPEVDVMDDTQVNPIP